MRRSLTAFLLLSLASIPAGALDLEKYFGLCQDFFGDPLLEEVAEQAEQRIALAHWITQLQGPTELAQAETQKATDDLRVLLGRLKKFRPGTIDTLHGQLGDVFLATGRLELAMAAYRRAAEHRKGSGGRCGTVHGDWIYTLEIAARHEDFREDTLRRVTNHILRREPRTGQVLKRTLLPKFPIALASGEETLRVFFRHPPEMLRLVEGRLAFPLWLPDSFLDLLRQPRLRAAAFTRFTLNDERKVSHSLIPRGGPGEEVSADLAELEEKARRAVFEDPTQPWNLFLLGQCLWVQDRRDEAAATWRQLLEAESFAPFPHNEWMAMAWYFEYYHQPAWADRAYRKALLRRRALPYVVKAGTTFGQVVQAKLPLLTVDWPHWPHFDVERAYLWWNRLQEISVRNDMSGFYAVLWVEHWRREGNLEREAAARHSLRQARRSPGLVLTAGAEYARWLFHASLLALLVFLCTLPTARFHRRKALSKLALASLMALFALATSSLLLLFQLYRLSAYSYMPGSSDALEWIEPEQEGTGERERFRAALGSHVTGDFERARRLYQSLPSSPKIEHQLAALERGLPPFSRGELEPFSPPKVTAQGFEEWFQRTWQSPTEGLRFLLWLLYPDVEARDKIDWQWHREPSLAELRKMVGFSWKVLIPFAFVFGLLAFPAQRVRRVSARILQALIPGAFHLERGHFIQAYAVLWIFLFGLGPLLWVALHQPYDSPLHIPKPGPLSEIHLAFQKEEAVFLPPDSLPTLQENSWLMLSVFPGFKVFIALATLSLLASLYLHCRDQRITNPFRKLRTSRPLEGPLQEASNPRLDQETGS